MHTAFAEALDLAGLSRQALTGGGVPINGTVTVDAGRAARVRQAVAAIWEHVPARREKLGDHNPTDQTCRAYGAFGPSCKNCRHFFRRRHVGTNPASTNHLRYKLCCVIDMHFGSRIRRRTAVCDWPKCTCLVAELLNAYINGVITPVVRRLLAEAAAHCGVADIAADMGPAAVLPTTSPLAVASSTPSRTGAGAGGGAGGGAGAGDEIGDAALDAFDFGADDFDWDELMSLGVSGCSDVATAATATAATAATATVARGVAAASVVPVASAARVGGGLSVRARTKRGRGDHASMHNDDDDDDNNKTGAAMGTLQPSWKRQRRALGAAHIEDDDGDDDEGGEDGGLQESKHSSGKGKGKGKGKSKARVDSDDDDEDYDMGLRTRWRRHQRQRQQQGCSDDDASAGGIAAVQSKWEYAGYSACCPPLPVSSGSLSLPLVEAEEVLGVAGGAGSGCSSAAATSTQRDMESFIASFLGDVDGGTMLDDFGLGLEMVVAEAEEEEATSSADEGGAAAGQGHRRMQAAVGRHSMDAQLAAAVLAQAQMQQLQEQQQQKRLAASGGAGDHIVTLPVLVNVHTPQ